MNVSVGRTPSSGKERSVPRAPGESLDGGRVVRLGEFWHERSRVPDVDHVVVTSGGELLAIGAPCQSTDLTDVVLEGRDVVLLYPDVGVVDSSVSCAGGEEVIVPRQRRASGLVT